MITGLVIVTVVLSVVALIVAVTIGLFVRKTLSKMEADILAIRAVGTDIGRLQSNTARISNLEASHNELAQDVTRVVTAVTKVL